tara:strand:- start:147 stop:314 length:168 start_codon:yes stop_codon:yes gene_type:complete
MTTATIKAAVEDTFQTLKQFKDTYCPDGRTCDDIMAVGLMSFMVWFMYIAMAPIF